MTEVTTPARTIKHGFTVLESVAAVAIVGVLVSILVPVLGDARGSAHTAMASNTQRQLAIGTTVYADFADAWIPGINTSGMRLSRAVRERPEIINRYEDIPTQDVDWLTSSVPDLALSRNRAERMHEIFDLLADPALNRDAELWESAGEGMEEVETWLEETGKTLHATSYLMPIAFQLFGGFGVQASNGPADRYYTRYGQYTPRFVPQTGDAIMKRSYTPRLTSIGSPAVKLANATGLRYYNEGDRITTNAAYQPTRLGAFATWGAIYSGSESYGQPLAAESGQDRNETDGKQSPLVYRHKGRIIGAFFDGHAELLDVESSQNPILWYPSGSQMGETGRDIVDHAFTYVSPGDLIP